MKITWQDITSYSRNEPRQMRTPRVLECILTPHISFRVHKHIHFGDAWLLTADCVGLCQYDLETDDIETAKEAAVAVMIRKLREKQAELDAAIESLT